MFSKASSRSERNAGGGAASSAPSVVSADTHLTGDMVSEGEVHIDGRLDGNIRCGKLVISRGGSVNGEIEAQDCNIFGTVSGQIRCRSVAVAGTARINGDIHHEILSVEQGAYVNGLCRRVDDGAAQNHPETAPGQKVVSIPQQRAQAAGEG